MPLDETLSGNWRRIQGELFPALGEEPGPLGERHQKLATVLELIRIKTLVGMVEQRVEYYAGSRS